MSEVEQREVWIEGMRGVGDFGENFPAEFLGHFTGTWREACQQAAAQEGWKTGPGAFELDRFGPDRHAYWGLELYDNEYEAKRANG